MRCQSKLRWDESFHVVAAFAAAFVEAPGKLSSVCIDMAIAARLVRDLPFKITAGVTFFTGDIAMPATQWERRQIMIESAAANISPTLRRVAFRAGVAEAAAMWILVARCAIRKRHAGILHKCRDRLIPHFFSRRLFGVTFGAGDIFMFPREHELYAVMRKFCRWCPTCKIMAAFTRGAELPAMLIRMTGATFL